MTGGSCVMIDATSYKKPEQTTKVQACGVGLLYKK